MRGPYDTPKRSHVIKTRLDDDEYEFFLRKCQVYGMNQSEMIRSSLDKLVINPVIKFSPVNKELLHRLPRESETRKGAADRQGKY